MALPTVGEMLQQARQVYLSDTYVGEIFTDPVLLPFAARAFEELNSKLARIGHQVTETTIATLQLIPPAKEITPPDDFLEAISLEERALGSGSEDEWTEMVKERILTSGVPHDTLGAWDWAGNKIVSRGATTSRQLKLRYLRFMPGLILDTQQPIVLNCKTFISARVAALAAGHIGGNPEKAAYIMIDANDALEDLMGISINGEQVTPTRRRPFRR